MNYLGERENGTGSLLKVGWGIAGKLQLTLIYTGLLSFNAVDIAVSTSSCASSRLFTTAWNPTNQLYFKKIYIQKLIINYYQNKKK